MFELHYMSYVVSITFQKFMPTLENEDIKRKLVEVLLRLNNLSKNKAALALGLKRQNLYGWLKGVDPAIANSKKLELLALLGVRNGTLADDQIHRWCVTDLDDVKNALLILTSQTDKPQRLFILNLWPANDSGAVLRLTTRDHHHVYLLLYYPLRVSAPPPINATSLGIGETMHSLMRLTKEQWGEWLKPDGISLSAASQIIDHEILFNRPPGESDANEQTDVEGYDTWEPCEPPKPTAEQIEIWDELLYRALMSGKSFDQSVHMTKVALGLYVLGENMPTR